MKNLKFTLMTMVTLAYQAYSHADTRYEILCVTSPEVPMQVVVYDNLIAIYSEKNNYEAFTYLREAKVFQTPAKFAREASSKEITGSGFLKTTYKNQDFNHVGQDGKSLDQLYFGGRVVEATKTQIVLRNPNTKETHFQIPFFADEVDDAVSVSRDDLIFAGKKVQSVVYRVCGDGAD